MYVIHFIHRPNEDENEVSRIAKIKQYATPTAQENARCKVCFKKFGDGEFFKLCCSCKGKVCEDCSASYGPKEAEVSIFYSHKQKPIFLMSGSGHLDRASNDEFSVECLFWFFQPARKVDLKVVQITKNDIFWVNASLWYLECAPNCKILAAVKKITIQIFDIQHQFQHLTLIPNDMNQTLFRQLFYWHFSVNYLVVDLLLFLWVSKLLL